MDTLWRRLGHVPDPRRRRTSPTGLAALAVAAILCAALIHQLGLIDRFRSDLWSGVGEIGHSVLADGSRIDLNTDTAVALRFTDTERGIELLRGEAFFDVVPDSRRPFVVRGNGLSVRAIGTRFFVRADGADSPVGSPKDASMWRTSTGTCWYRRAKRCVARTGRPLASSRRIRTGAWPGGRVASSSRANGSPPSWGSSTATATAASSHRRQGRRAAGHRGLRPPQYGRGAGRDRGDDERARHPAHAPPRPGRGRRYRRPK